MKLGIGIDTGGTYTDAVVYRFDTKEVLSSAKSLTTREDLSLGITSALSKLDRELLGQAEIAALSTTLATNACVEGKGGRAKLLFLGLENETLQRVGGSYGLTRAADVFGFPCGGTFDGKELPDPDWDSLLENTREWLGDADGLGIVELYAMNNGAVAEREAKRRFGEAYDLPMVCSSELFSGLNSVQRGSGTLLNAKLVPIIRDFMDAIRRSFVRLGITAPMVVVRSDGSLMSEAFSRRRPVETILCGPAASVLGGVELAERSDSIIVDMGGTTTDVSLVKGGIPVRAREGIQVGPWRTFVKGVLIDTFGLGGDSAVRFAGGSSFSLHADRVVPISLLAQRHPSVRDRLRRLLDSKAVHTRPIHEFYTLVRDISGRSGFTEEEQALCRVLKDGPLDIRTAAEALDTDIYRLNTARLETEGIVLRAGLTPTDVMHLKGDFDAYDREAAELTARFLMRCMGMDCDSAQALEDFCDQVYNRVKKTLFCNLVRILLTDRDPSLLKSGLGPQLEALIEARWESFLRGEAEAYFSTPFLTGASLVGIGAPIHIFLPDVAKALGTDCVIPPNAGVANAVGAVVGNVAATVEVEVRPNHTPGGIKGFFVCSSESNRHIWHRDEAIELARETARRLAVEEAQARGVMGDIRVELQEENSVGQASRGSTVDLGSRITATARGGAVL